MERQLNQAKREAARMASEIHNRDNGTSESSDDTVARLLQGIENLIQRSASQPFIPRTETVHYNVLPDLSKNIEIFDASASSTQAKNWLRSIESMGTLHRWTSAIMLETARSHLQRGAKNWYLWRVEELQNWERFCAEFRSSLVQEKSLTERWKEITRRTQKENKATTDSFFDIMRLCNP